MKEVFRYVFSIYMPYAHKYANAVTEHGMIGALTNFMPDEGLFKTALRSGSALATKDVEGIMKILIDMEMKMFAGLPTPVVFIQNVFTDLLLWLGFTSAFKVFHDHIVEKYNAEPGYITMNMPMLYEVLTDLGMPDAIRMRHATPHFAHVFSGDGYSAGYYSYMWSEVLDADAFAAFEEAGDPFDADTAARLREHVYGRGGATKPDVTYTRFRGRMPGPEALLRGRGLVA